MATGTTDPLKGPGSDFPNEMGKMIQEDSGSKNYTMKVERPFYKVSREGWIREKARK